ncbi:MAG TPA: hypothetical protein VGO62_21515, partial [Myxococcota bacterium]
LENRPSPEELGLSPQDLLAPDAEGARTEPTRLLAFVADPPSTTAPGRDAAIKRASQQLRDDVIEDDDFDPDAPTTETARPTSSAFARMMQEQPPSGRPAPAPAPAPAPHRVSTGSRRVISLSDADDKKKR